MSRYWLEFWQDLRYGARGLWAHPSFTLAAVSALVLGIGVNASVFNVYKSLTSETWAIRDPQSTVQLLWQRGQAGRWLGFSWAHFRYLQANARTMQGLAAEIGVDARVTQGDSTWDAEVGTVSANFMDLLAPRFALGHGFTAGADDLSQPAAEAVLSYDTWRTRFGRDPNVIGTRIDLDRYRFQVIGVAPPAFNGAAVTETDLWVGAAWGDILQPGRQRLKDPEACCVTVVGRLKPGIGRDAALAELTTLHSRFLASLGNRPRRLIFAAPSLLANPSFFRDTIPVLLAVSITSCLVLLLACANVANLQLARATARRQEIALRVSLGASRNRIIRQLMVESLCVSGLAGSLSLAISAWLPGWLFRELGGSRERFTFAFENDLGVLGFVIVATFVSAFLFGLAPALSAVRDATGVRNCTFVTSGGRLRTVLLATQVGLCTILLTGTALLARSLDHVRNVDTGLPQDKLLVMSTRFDSGGLTRGQVHELFTSLTERATGLPGVESVAFASGVPFGGGCDASVQDPRTKELVPVTMYEVSGSFFETLGIPLLAGRRFTATDAGRNVLVLNEAASARFWPGQNPIGKTLERSEVIGIVRNLGNVQSRSQADVYVLLDPPSRCKNLLVIRHAGDPTALSSELIRLARRLDRRFAPSVVRYDEFLAQANESADVAARVAGVLGSLALVLACVGVYGVASFGVSQQTRELGVRAAIGAQPLALLTMVLKQTLRTVMIGACMGLVGALAFGQLLTSLLHGVSPADPLALAMTCVVVLTASTLATWGPAYRASRVDPAITLRYE